MKFVFTAICLIFSALVLAEEEPVSPPLDPAYEGVHGMLLFNQDSRLYASHLPSFHKPHDAQIIYKIKTDNAALLSLVRDAEQVTIEPESFNLQRLLRGEEFKVKAKVYLGHFERGGSMFFEDIDISFIELKYLRMLEDLAEPGMEKVYDLVDLDKGGRLLIHQIQNAPSFDHIALLTNPNSCLTTIRTGKLVPEESFLISRLSYCGSMKRVYYETKDFAVNKKSKGQ